MNVQTINFNSCGTGYPHPCGGVKCICANLNINHSLNGHSSHLEKKRTDTVVVETFKFIGRRKQKMEENSLSLSLFMKSVTVKPKCTEFWTLKQKWACHIKLSFNYYPLSPLFWFYLPLRYANPVAFHPAIQYGGPLIPTWILPICFAFTYCSFPCSAAICTSVSGLSALCGQTTQPHHLSQLTHPYLPSFLSNLAEQFNQKLDLSLAWSGLLPVVVVSAGLNILQDAFAIVSWFGWAWLHGDITFSMAMMNSINSCLLCTTTLVFMVLHILSPASCLKQQQQPPSSPQVSYNSWCTALPVLTSGSHFFVWLEWNSLLCRACYLGRKAGSARPLRAATTSVTSATHAWRSRCLPYQAAYQSNQVLVVRPKLLLWSSLTQHRDATSTPITSPWVGNAAAKTTFSTPRDEVANRGSWPNAVWVCNLSSILIVLSSPPPSYSISLIFLSEDQQNSFANLEIGYVTGVSINCIRWNIIQYCTEISTDFWIWIYYSFVVSFFFFGY